MYIGVDGGGTKTKFLMLDHSGAIVALHQAGSSYYGEVSLEGVRQVIVEGIRALLGKAGVAAGAVTHAFFGLPAFGEDSEADARLALLPREVLDADRYTCGNDMVCSWAGSLACSDGISIVAGTGSIGYGEYDGRHARAGGWGELFGDEGSAYWIAREGLNAFSRMSDGRSGRGALYDIFMRHFAAEHAIDVAGKINNLPAGGRSTIAQLAPVVEQAALAGDAAAARIYERAADELAALVVAIRRNLAVPAGVRLPVSYSGGVFSGAGRILELFRAALDHAGAEFELRRPLLEPAAGAALYAARCCGQRLAIEGLINSGNAAAPFA